MTQSTSSLIKRLENAEKADRKLDQAIQRKLFGDWPMRGEGYLWPNTEFPAYTASLDNALALVAECGQLVRYISWHRFEGNPEVVHATVGPSHFESKVGRHKSPAIALLLPLLHATGEGDG